LSKKYEEQRREKSEKFKNLNLYVKNLDETVDDAKLKEMFEQFGAITAATVMVDEKKASKGFGFVCFEQAEDATKAVTEMNGKMIGTKPLYVNRAQRKEGRRSMLEQQFQANMASQRMQPMAPVFYAPPGQMPGMIQPGLMYQQQMMGRRGGFPAQQSAMRGGGYPLYPQPMKQRGPRQGGPNRGQRMSKQQQRSHVNPGPPQQYAYNQNVQNVRNPPPPPQPIQVPQVAMPGPPPTSGMSQGELTASMLASATPEMQKQMLGERLFPLIQQSQPELAAKITGMLLEMEVAEILTLLESQSELQAKIQEAIDVLNAQGGDN